MQNWNSWCFNNHNMQMSQLSSEELSANAKRFAALVTASRPRFLEQADCPPNGPVTDSFSPDRKRRTDQGPPWSENPQKAVMLRLPGCRVNVGCGVEAFLSVGDSALLLMTSESLFHHRSTLIVSYWGRSQM